MDAPDFDRSMRKYYDWIAPSYKKPAHITISKEDQEEEDEYRREFNDRSRPMWSCGGWVPKPDDDERPLHRVPHRTRLLPTRNWIPPSYEKPADVQVTVEDQKEEEEYRREFADYSTPMWRLGYSAPSPKPNDEQSLHTGVYRKRILATETDESASKRLKPSLLTGQGTATIPKPQQAKPKQHLGPVKFANDFIEAPAPRAFIPDPTERIIQCVKVLCGNHGVMVDEFITLYIGEQGTAKIIEQVFEVIDPAFLQLLALPQSERAKAAKTTLQPLDTNSGDMVVYMAVLDVPAGAEFWKSFRHAFSEGAVDESIDHVMIYIKDLLLAKEIPQGTE